MSKSDCQCAVCACAAASEIVAEAGRPEVDHNHKRLPGILRYRGLENEAELAARLLKVESLIVTLQSVRDDLDVSMAALLSNSMDAEQDADDRGKHTSSCCASETA